MKFTVLTLFPDQVLSFLHTSIIGRAADRGILSIEAVNIRDYAGNANGKVDDTLYGGGKGMLMMCQPVFDAWKHVSDSFEEKPHTIYMSPKGKTLNQKMAMELSKLENVIILCGHYEGIDQRVIDEIVDEEISIGDYVLTGGETAACVLIDSISRMVDGVLPDSSAYENESHMDGYLESSQYTKPDTWHGATVPDVLLNGNHAKIEKWRSLEGLYDTWKKRPDLFNKKNVSYDDWNDLLHRDKEKESQ